MSEIAKKNRRILWLCVLGFLIVLGVYSCHFSPRLRNTVDLMWRGVMADGSDEKERILMFALEALPEEPIFDWGLWPYESETNEALKIRLYALEYSVTGRNHRQYDSLLELASVRPEDASSRTQMKAIAALGYLTRRQEDTARAFAELLRRPDVDGKVRSSLLEMLWRVSLDLDHNTMTNIVPEYDSWMGK